MKPEPDSKATPLAGNQRQSPWPQNDRPDLRRQAIQLALLAACLAAAFALPLFDLVRFALASGLYSHILLVPFISLYLVWLKRKQLPAEYQPSRGIALALALPGLAAVAAYWIGLASGWTPSGQDRLSLLLNAGLLLFAAGCARLLGRRTLRAVAFPLAFLLFMVPLPSFLERAVESFLQHVSADAIYVLLQLSGTTVFRDGTLFVLPGVRLEVAPECCGIHSTLVLVITSLLAGELLLLRARTKILLLAGVILIGILRNAIRVWVLAQIAVHGNPGILDSDLHHRGGPLFFAASLVPCFLLIWFLRRLDLRAKPIAPRSTD